MASGKGWKQRDDKYWARMQQKFQDTPTSTDSALLGFRFGKRKDLLLL